MGPAEPLRTTVPLMDFETITYEVRDRVGLLHFNRPEVRMR